MTAPARFAEFIAPDGKTGALQRRDPIDDDSFFEMIAQQPGYLGTPDAQKRIDRWRRAVSSDGDEAARVQARANLKRVGTALVPRTPGGPAAKLPLGPYRLLTVYRLCNVFVSEVPEASEQALLNHYRHSPFASAFEFSDADAFAAISGAVKKRGLPSSRASLAKEILALLFGVSVKTLEARLTEAQKLVDADASTDDILDETMGDVYFVRPF